ncbi:YbhB/YbcL family Raf kinase inhibitor-like protein [Tistrella sp. BH-R2-4]|uniref:YbhB/YbcL family Raf kinase inhibitor-like protein n=2 Tax=Geminicoccaceae TaxID=2066434 RepID=A0ABU9YPG7_9PROT
MIVMTKTMVAGAAALAVALAAGPATAGGFRLTSTDLADGRIGRDHVLSADYGFGCDGGNLSPQLSWQGAPAGTRSFVLTMHDPDAPTGIGWMHWVVANIPADAEGLPRGAAGDPAALPAGALQTRTDFGAPGYGGPCPPEGQSHRYVFTLTALAVDHLPPVTADAMPALVGFLAGANALAAARLEARYGR